MAQTITTRTLRYISDPGHGWLEVKLADLHTLSCEFDISNYSYFRQPQGMAYLEEDVDASVFFTAAKAAGWEITVDESYQAITFIRNCPSYGHYKKLLKEQAHREQLLRGAV